MRTTVTLDDDTLALLQEQVRTRGITFKQAVNEAIRRALAPAGRRPARFRTQVADLGEPALPLDRALALAADLEDEEIVRKMRLRK